MPACTACYLEHQDEKEHRNTMPIGRWSVKIRRAKPVAKTRRTEIKTSVRIIIQKNLLFIES